MGSDERGLWSDEGWVEISRADWPSGVSYVLCQGCRRAVTLSLNDGVLGVKREAEGFAGDVYWVEGDS